MFARLCLLIVLAVLCLQRPASAQGLPSAQTAIAEADALVAEVEAMWAKGDRDAIRTKLEEALGLRMLALGDENAAVADILGRLGRNEWNRRNWSKAEDFFGRAVAMAERVDPNSAETARLLGDLAAALRETGKLAPAEDYARRSIAMRRQLVGPRDPWVAAGLENLTRILLRQDRPAEAAAAAAEGLAIRETALGPDHEATLRSAALLDAAEVAQLPWWHWRRFAWDRLASAEGWAFPAWIVCMAGAVLLAHPRAARWTSGNLYPLRPMLYLASLPFGAYCTAVAVMFLVLFIWPDLDPDNRRNVGKAGAMAGLALNYFILSRLIRLIAPDLVAAEGEREPVRPMPEVARSIRIGAWCITLPSIVIMLAFIMLTVITAVRLEPFVRGSFVAILAIAGFLAAFVLAWAWWSFAVPRWRVWSMRRVEDLAVWEQAVVAANILNSPNTVLGRWAARTEWWTPSLRAEADRILRERGARPPPNP